MIQYYLDLKNQVKAAEDKRIQGGQIQKIYSTAYYISMAIRTPGKTWHLYFGRGGGQEGFWLHDQAPPSSLRRKDNFLEYLRRHMSSCGLYDIRLDVADRILALEYQKYGKLQSFLFFWKARKLYFLHHYQESPETPFRLLLSWHGKAITLNEEPDNLFSYFNEVGRRDDMKHDFESRKLGGFEELLKEELQAAALKGLSTNPTFLQRKKENIENDLRKAKQWERLQSLLDKDESLEGYEIKVGDHKIKFESELNPYERRNLVFQKIKKLKRGEGILHERLQTVEKQLEGKEKEVHSQSTIPIVKPVWGKEELSTSVVETKRENEEYRIFKDEKWQIG